MNKEWVHLNRTTNEYLIGRRAFISNALDVAALQGKIKCPCRHCCNMFYRDPFEVDEHLYVEGRDEVINEIRHQRCSYLRLKLCKKGDPSGTLFSYYMVEEQSLNGPSYVEFPVHVHRQIQIKWRHNCFRFLGLNYKFRATS